MKKRLLFILVFMLPFIVGFSLNGHFWITDKTFQHLPAVMHAFQERFRNPVLYNLPPYYMYPDLYERGHSNEKLANYAANHFNKLVSALQDNRWGDAEIEIGYLSHYSGDAASPTQNVPAMWGEIDDAFDLWVDLHIKEIELNPDFEAPQLIDNIYQFYLTRCHEAAAYGDSLMVIYRSRASDTVKWEQSQPIFQKQLNQAVRDLRNVLYTAWERAGRPMTFPKAGGCSNWPFISEANAIRKVD